ncbi:MAG: hypothetical protein SV375_06865, partial [Thermodesulfobacteriota bacterium]|nr:hypothetical protein [Thermodesulfobacteriota bacterium]
ISMSGLNLVIHSRNLHLIPHNVGDRFHLNTKLPNGKRLRVNAEIITLKTTKDSVSLGMRFLSLSDEMYGARKTLGFFLLPT